METRKVQMTGGSTYTVSLPKGWATDNDVGSGTVVELYPEDDALLLTPQNDTERQEGTLDVSDLEGERLTRAVMTMYVSGFDIIRLEAGRITTSQRRAIRDATQSLVGVEVLEETTDSVVIQDLLDSSELSIVNAVRRMRLIAASMLEDAVRALIENDDDIAYDVIERDDDVDRLWLVVSRIFRATLRSPRAAEELGVSREDCFDFHSSARQLERVADHASKISQLSLKLGGIPDEVADALADLHADASAVLEKAMDALFAEETDEANQLGHAAHEAVLEIDEHTRYVDDMLRDLDPVQAQSLGLIVDSLSRSADYGGNIAETALQKAAPRPRS
ncbi:phosphate uptake regulator PhoU [Natronobacterium gregoryi]|uniref:PhoU family protein n=2 Tax=Natronobacterium gregoryi TaxID=44930 RepID=L0AEZ2_NATGS|nr:phosphate uptake regulator PhoU [Natronobacterium gregoryi]AFZ71610.1 phosphate uptake regulator [Natronobacterium gregoryi SP2]ELY66665.1 PhoU family protein [Natronobacterium gregoryi SP2]PLK21377.1 phosphate uptake regulator PhoU [Natronobacterium gregoryi SP2]SFI80547.1 Phosphate uptake regulator [Natronobacterium gregoryi]